MSIECLSLSVCIELIWVYEKKFRSQQIYSDREDLYRNNEHEKPPFNYAQIIAMAMMDCGKMTLKDICKWIQDRFAYFRCNDNWNVCKMSRWIF